ncbi:hypothetical protein JCGZ_08407 [Jatropha curcas]|uniref:PWWP domain-containing protein n=2 Tax=Jatropha curcas TaxID=180498 RepID=A0A067KMD0_JATCU|nr:hypothetical protein JCGZ_08407 [Jatropha curcas]
MAKAGEESFVMEGSVVETKAVEESSTVEGLTAETKAVEESSTVIEGSIVETKAVDESSSVMEVSVAEKKAIEESSIMEGSTAETKAVEESSTVMEGSIVETKAVGEEDAMMANDENLNPKVEVDLEGTRGDDAVEGVISSSEKGSVSTAKDLTTTAILKPLDEQTRVAVDGKVASGNHKEIEHPNMEGKAVEESLAVMEDSIVEAKVIDEEAAVTVNDENLNPKVEAALEETCGADAVEGVIFSSENDSVSTAKDPITTATSKSLDEQTQVAVDGKVVSMHNKEVKCPNIEVKSVEESSTIMEGSIVEDELVGEEAAAMVNDEILNPKVEAALEGPCGADAVEGVTSSSENDLVSAAKDPIAIATSKSLDEQTRVVVDEKLISLENIEITHPHREGKAVDGYSIVMEDSNMEAKDVGEEAAAIVEDESYPKIEAALEGTHGVDAVEGVISSSENDSVSTAKDPITTASSKSLDEQNQVAVDGKVVSIDKKEVTCPNVEAKAVNESSTVMEGSILETKAVEESSTVREDSIIANKVVGERTVMILTDENLNPEVEAALEGTHGADAVEGVISSSKKGSVSTAKDPITTATSKSLDEQTQVAVDGKVVSMDNEEIKCPNIEGMDTDAFNENFCFSVEELQATFETANGSTENDYDAFADMQSLQQPTQVVVEGEVAATDNMVLLNSKEDRKLLIEECSDQSNTHGSAKVDSNVEPEIGVDKQAGIQEKQGEVETSNESSENHSAIGLNSTTLCRSAQAEVTEMDDKVHTDPNSEGPVGGRLHGVLTSSGNYQHIKAEGDLMETDTGMTLTDKDKVLVSAAVVSEPSEKDQGLKLKESLDNNVSDTAKVDSNIGQLMDAQEQVAHVDQLGEEDKKAGQNSEAEAVFIRTEIKCPVTNGGQTVNSVVTLNPKTGLEGPAEGDQYMRAEESLDESASRDLFETESNVGKETAVDEHEQIGLKEGQEMEAEELDTDSEQPRFTENTVKLHQASYQLPPDDEGEFIVSDLVWGKVRSHPWWPGQIFDPSDASEKAMKYHKKDCFLVAYFGDRTFAWNEASLLKSFRSNFSQVEKQSNLESFQNAVNCALEEVSRRVEFGLACSCIPKDTYDKIKLQMVENAGIREESSKRYGVDKSFHANLFEPGKLLEYMKALAQSPAGGADKLELVITKSQLLAFYRLKGYSQLSEFQFCGGLLENADSLHFADEVVHASPVCGDDGQISSSQEVLQTQRSSYNKRKHNLKDTILPRKKERSMSELMDESWDSIDDELGSDEKANNKLVSPSGKKRKGSDSFADDSAMEGRKTISLAKVSTTAPPVPKPSFKIGECIRRVASQMTGSPSILKANSQKQEGSSDGLVGDGSDVSFQNNEDAEMRRMTVPTEYSSLDELLSQLTTAARDPLTRCSSSTIIVSFFSDFRNSVIMEQHDKVGGKRRHSVGASPETFEFEDMGDTYWTDRVIQNGSEEQPSRKSRKRDNLFVPVELDKPANKSNSRKRYSDVNCGQAAEKPAGSVDEKAPAELVMHFPVVDSVPSEISLNKMFRRFGPLKESETEVDKDTNRARVVFKRCSDAEAAYGSAPKFNIFGSMLVNYQLNYTISVPFKSEPVVTLQEEDATLFLQY